MAKPVVVSLALSLCTLLILILCGGIIGGPNTAVAASSSAANTATATTAGDTTASAVSCDSNPNQPECLVQDDKDEDDNSSHSTGGENNSCESSAGGGTDGECESSPPIPDSLTSATTAENGNTNGGKYQSGDVVELFNESSQDIQIVFPSLVGGVDPDGGGYTVTKTTDGKDVQNIPERFLHHYIPYKVGAEVLCNIGDFKPARPMIVRCTVLGYEATETKGAKVLQNNYSVKVHQTKANDEFETKLPVWKMQRRYRAAS
jgi:hypothetical protein